MGRMIKGTEVAWTLGNSAINLVLDKLIGFNVKNSA